ncbi:MAG: hypothetical protein RSB97_08440, partial [Christensenella sp.]
IMKKQYRNRAMLIFVVIAVTAVILIVWMSIDLHNTYNQEVVLQEVRSADGKYIAQKAESTVGLNGKNEVLYLLNVNSGKKEGIFLNRNKAVETQMQWDDANTLSVSVNVKFGNRAYCEELATTFERVKVNYRYYDEE